MQKIGFILFLLGAGGMDSPNMAVPAVMAISGLGIIAATAGKEAMRNRAKEEHYRNNVENKAA